MNTAGAAARIFTSIQENAGTSMMRGYMVSLVLNAIILGQIVIYGSKEEGRGGGRKKKNDSGTTTTSTTTEKRRSQRVKGE
jgi:mannose-P-dolichol utilization defect protein 1